MTVSPEFTVKMGGFALSRYPQTMFSGADEISCRLAMQDSNRACSSRPEVAGDGKDDEDRSATSAIVLAALNSYQNSIAVSLEVVAD